MPDKADAVREMIRESIAVKERLLTEHTDAIVAIADRIAAALLAGGKLVAFGNGGSAADAQHMAGEFVNRFLMERPAYPGIALTTDTSILTCIGNDRSFDEVFSRQVEALVQPGDVVVAISTSGNSPNVLRGVAAARERGAVTIGLAGRTGGALRDRVDVALCAPSDETPRIQEAHELVIHAVCALVERALTEHEDAAHA